MMCPLVSVAIITYNQQEYIEKALHSVLSQQTDFPFEVIIGDDGSTDNTSAICQRITSQNPGVVKHIRHDRNIGYIHNLLQVFSQCSGEFIAILEADDHWVSPHKLADQVKVFRKNPSVSLCFTNSYIDNIRDPQETQYFYRENDRVYTAADCLENIVAPTSTFMFKREMFEAPVWFSDLIVYEYFLLYLLAGKGDIYYLNKLTACRIQHFKGQSTTLIDLTDDKVIFKDAVTRYKVIREFSPKDRRKVRNIVLLYQINVASEFISRQKLYLAGKLISLIEISKITPGRKGIATICAYLKLRLKFYMVKRGVYTPRMVTGLTQ